MVQIRCMPIFLVILGLSLIADIAFASDGGLYVGVGLGDVSANHEAADFGDGSISDGVIDNSDSAWKVFAGYRFNHHFAVEVAYADLHNDTDRTTTFTGTSDGVGDYYASLPGGNVSVDIDQTAGIAIEMIGSWPLATRLSLSAKAGVLLWEARQTTIELRRRDESLNGTGAIIGTGLEYRFQNGIAIRSDVERYSNVAKTDQIVVVASVLFRF